MRLYTIYFSLTVAGLLAAPSTTPTPVTFSKQVAPILQKRCQQCHRPGEAAPMALLTYEQARPWAKAIKEAVLSKRMPPWFADPHYGKFKNDRSLGPDEVETIKAWVEAGAPEGDRRDLPAPVQWLEGWNIGKPDQSFELPNPYTVPASGTIEYTYYVIPSGFTEDKWVQMAEVRPGDRSVVHHVIAFIRPPGSKWLADAKPGEPFVPKRGRRSNNSNNDGGGSEGEGARNELLVGYAPGLPAAIYEPGQAKLVKAGSDFVLQMHYTAKGKEATDRTKIGLVFAKEPVRERVVTIPASNSRFAIPPGADNHEVKSSFTFREDVRLISLMPHMHLRGKDFEYVFTYPAGEKEVALKVPRYDFNWQLWYYLDGNKVIPKNTRLDCTAHFDNSANNKANPDPAVEVKWGDQSWEEMMIGWFDVAFDAKLQPEQIWRAPRGQAGRSE